MGGFVSLVGAGPWDPQLLTLAGRDRLERADVVIADYLVNPAVLMHCRPGAEIVQRQHGPRTGARILQADINRMLIEHAQAGRHVVRLKGGDPCMFGRGAEEAEILREHGIPYEFVPGVSSPIAAPEAAGIPVTHRDHTPAVTFVSGWEAYDKAGLHVQWEHLAKSAGTIVLMMSVRNARENATKLIEAGRDADTPAAAIRWGTRGIQRTLVGTLGNIADVIDAEDLRPPTVMVIGDVVELRDRLAWFERLPLFGRRVIVTRSDRQSGRLVHMLASQGADAVPFPCLEVAPPDDVAALDAAVADVGQHHGVLLSSPNGVRAFFAALARAGLDARALAGRRIAVVGTGTADTCRAHGITPDLVPDRARAEGLVDLLTAQRLLEGRWLHVRADEGRAVIGDAITAAGGEYRLVTGYRTVRPEVSTLLLRSLLPPAENGEGMDAVCFASGKAARHFIETVGAAHGERRALDLLSAAKAIAIGPVTEGALESLGVRVDATADEQSDDGLLRAVVTALATGDHRG